MAKEKITELTQEQTEALAAYEKEWLAIGLSTERANRKEMEDAVAELYATIKEPLPPIRWAKSPKDANDILNSIKYPNGENKEYFRVTAWGNMEAYWIAFYLYCHDVLGVPYSDEHLKLLKIWEKIARNGHWWYPFDNVVVCCEKPVAIHFNEQNMLHCTTGPAVEYEDGWGPYVIESVRVPRYVVMEPDTITVEKIEAESNIEIRRIMINQMGISKYLSDSDATLVDLDNVKVTHDSDELMPRALMRDKKGNQYLCGTDGSTKRVYYMKVPPDAKTCRDAHNMIAGFDESKIISSS